jgi:predicted RNase H-like HicB family nuclease
VPGCISTGDTLDETLQNIKEALEFHLETLLEDGEELPTTSSLEQHLSNGDIVLDDDIIIAYIHVRIPESEVV